MSERSKPSSHEQIIIDERLRLRSVGESEASELFKLTDENREYLAEYLPWVHKTKSRTDSLVFIQNTQRDRLEGLEYGFGIYYDDQLVGHASLMHLTDQKKPEIGYWIAEEYSGKGLITKVADEITSFGFNVLGLHEIVIKAAVKNVGSNRVAQKIGYNLNNNEISDNGTKINVWRKINDQK